MPHANPSIVFCITCKGRAQHLEQTLPRNLVDNSRYPNCKFLLLDYGSRDHLATYLKTAQRGAMESGRLIVYHHPTVNAFRMSHAKNMAHRLGILEGADILVNLDADNSTGQNFACYVAEQMTNLEGTFLWANAKSVIGRARQGLAGRIAVSRNTFLKVGGYDERYIVWAPEDEDLKARVRRLGLEGIPIDGEYLYVIHHKDGLRFKEYPHAKPTPEAEAEAVRAVRESNTVIVNNGNFGCGTVYRNYGPDPIRLAPLPTRIFGIGMHKTGTTSLHTAFKLLGLDSAHWTGPWWAKKVWEEMVFNRSLTLEKHYAVCDLPFTLLYQQLDRAYPGSKFILTTRSAASWVESVRNHWEINSQKFGWDADCFTHKCHNLLYGRKTFDAETMLARFRQHNAEVAEYFKNRPDDLLVMDMEIGAGWPELCGFFGWRIPSIPYPQEFKTEKFRETGAGI